jgi:hypothetical protein
MRATSMRLTLGALALAALLALPSALAAQDAASGMTPPADATAPDSGASADDDFFGTESVVQAAPMSAKPQEEFLKYDAPKLGGSFSGSVAFDAYWDPAWQSGWEFKDWNYSLTPAASGTVTLVAKPSSDFGVNMDVRASYPFSKSSKVLTSATYVKDTDPIATGDQSSVFTGSGSVSVPNISVWALYSKFTWRDVYFSFGKQTIGWGVSKGAFQPANDIFAMSAVDLADTGAQREGPLSLQASYTIPRTLNTLYFAAGVPTASDLKPEDIRAAAKASFILGGTSIGVGGFYSYNDHPRGILFLNTGLADLDFFGEAIVKYGSERYFIEKGVAPSPANPLGLAAAEASDKLYLTAAGGATYSNANAKLSITAQYLFNGEAQTAVDYREASSYFLPNADTLYAGHMDQMDRMRFGYHYAYASITRTELVAKKLSGSVYAMSNLSDLSGFVSPSLSYQLGDYIGIKVGAAFNWGAPGTEYIVASPISGMSKTDKPGAAFNFTVTVGSGSF